MNQHKISLSLNTTEELLITFQDPLHEIDCCSNALIFYVQNNKTIELYNDSMRDGINALYVLLKKALNNKLQLHESITTDIGFLYNEYCNYICDENSKVIDVFSYIQVEKQNHWVGTCYHLWAKDLVSWIYNDNQGSIIFEVTPFYPYLYCEPEEKPNYVSYEEWIKTYTPFLIRTIPTEIAKQWFEQAEHILHQIDHNIKQWEAQKENK